MESQVNSIRMKRTVYNVPLKVVQADRAFPLPERVGKGMNEC